MPRPKSCGNMALRQELHDLPDNRKGSNTKYQVKDACLAAFSVFFTQSSSFLAHQSLMKQKKGQDNAQSLFGLTEIPCDNQIRNLLDPMAAVTVFGAFKTVFEWLDKNQVINKFKYLENQILLALDGTEYYSSSKINCPHCNCRKHRNGSKTYYHQVVTPVIVSPLKNQVINLAPEFIKKQDGTTKQANRKCSSKKMVIKQSSRDRKGTNNLVRR